MYIHLNLIGYVCLGVDVGVEGPMVVRGLILPILAPALAVGNRYLVVVAAQGAPILITFVRFFKVGIT